MYSYIIVDDEPLIRKGTRKKLESMDKLSCAGEASNGEAALELIRGKDPDLIITDMKMPHHGRDRASPGDLLPISGQIYHRHKRI